MKIPSSLPPVKKMKKVTSYFRSLKNSLKQWAGEKAQSLTSMSSGIVSSFESANRQQLQAKFDKLVEDNAKLQEEIRLLKDYMDTEFDV